MFSRWGLLATESGGTFFGCKAFASLTEVSDLEKAQQRLFSANPQTLTYDQIEGMLGTVCPACAIQFHRTLLVHQSDHPRTFLALIASLLGRGALAGLALRVVHQLRWAQSRPRDPPPATAPGTHSHDINLHEVLRELIVSLLGAGDSRVAEQALRELHAVGLEPTASLCALVIGGLLSHGPSPASASGEDPQPGLHGDLPRGSSRGAKTEKESQCELALALKADLPLWGIPPKDLTPIYDVIVRRLAKAGLIELAEAQLTEMHFTGVQPSLRIYNVLVHALLKDGAATRAVKLLNEMQASGCSADKYTYCAFIEFSPATSMCEGLVENMLASGVERSTAVYAALLSKLLQHRQPQRAAMWLGRMQQDGVAPSVRLYNQVIHGLARGGQMRHAEEVLDDMRAAGELPDVVTYTTMLQAYGRRGQQAGMQRTFEQLRADGITPDLTAYNAMVAALAEARRGQEAEEVLEEMARVGVMPDVVTFTTLIDAAGKDGRVKHAEELLRRMKRSGVAPNVYTYSALLRACNASGQRPSEEVPVEELEKIPLESKRINYHALVAALEDSGQGHRTEEVVAGLQSGQGGDVANYGYLIMALANRGNFDLAGRLLMKMREANLTPRLEVYTALIRQLGRAGLVDGMRSVLSDMFLRGLGATVDTYDALIEGLMRRGDLEGVRSLLETSWTIEVASTSQAKVYRSIRHALSQYEESGNARRLLPGADVWDRHEAMAVQPEASDEKSNNEGSAATYWMEVVWEILEHMKDAGIEPQLSTYNGLIRAQVETGRVQCIQDECVASLLEEMHRTGVEPDSDTFSWLLHMLAKNKQHEQLPRAEQIIAEFGLEPNFLMYSCTVHALAKARMFDDAEDLIGQMKREGMQPNKLTYSPLIFSLAQAGNLDDAVRVLEQMMDEGIQPDVLVYNGLIRLSLDSSDQDLAKHLYQQMLDSGLQPDDVTESLSAQLNSRHPFL
ncbi:hypothetical protein CYMTET_29428 [Cymbomonas tetramitiformis]|uniref:PROP1-like PPR domain-containing protein n=1 Tax=Cymbomonas tetramitiformis TaxID=36881 RepID=A0AAE0KUX7_9CHLO|nr:hypothetical protein CYMTET_29428 [Cymbomonas tetramitiformis]